MYLQTNYQLERSLWPKSSYHFLFPDTIWENPNKVYRSFPPAYLQTYKPLLNSVIYYNILRESFFLSLLLNQMQCDLFYSCYSHTYILDQNFHKLNKLNFLNTTCQSYT